MKKKKLLYVPGLISLIGLPALLFLLPVEDPVFQNSIHMTLPSDDTKELEEGVLRFDKASLKQTLAGKKVEQIYLTENHDYDGDIERYFLNRELTFIGNEMERLQFTHDTSIVLKVSFGNENTYGQFIYVLNLIILDRFRRYALYDNDLYLFPNEPPIPHDDLVDEFSPTDIGSSGHRSIYSITKWDIFLWDTEYRFRRFGFEVTDNRILCSGFLVLIVLPFTIHLFVRKKKKRLEIAQVV